MSIIYVDLSGNSIVRIRVFSKGNKYPFLLQMLAVGCRRQSVRSVHAPLAKTVNQDQKLATKEYARVAVVVNFSTNHFLTFHCLLKGKLFNINMRHDVTFNIFSSTLSIFSDS